MQYYEPLCTERGVNHKDTIYLKNIKIMDNKITCSIGDVMKTTSAKRHQEPLVFDAYPHCKSLCVVHYMKQYIKRTENLRGEGEQRLFISTRPPHQGISRDTLARWTKNGLTKSGVDMELFTPHSTRGASTSRAATKISLGTIMKTAGWRSSSTFAKFYKKPIQTEGTTVKHLL